MDNIEQNNGLDGHLHAEQGHVEEITNAQRVAFKKLFSKYKEEVKQDFERISSDINSIEKFKIEYIDGTDNNQSVKSKIDSFNIQIASKHADIKLKHEQILKLYTELFEGTSTTDSIEDTINELVTKSEEKVEAIETKKKEIETFYEAVFGKDRLKDHRSFGVDEFPSQLLCRFVTTFDQHSTRELAPGDAFNVLACFPQGQLKFGRLEAVIEIRFMNCEPSVLGAFLPAHVVGLGDQMRHVGHCGLPPTAFPGR